MNTTSTDAVLTTAHDRDMHIERELRASRERVWAAYTEPELLAQWWGRGHRLDVERWELERGGHWRFVEHWEGQTAGFEGRFREVTPIDQLSYTFEWDGMPGHPSVDTITFRDLGDGRTRIVIDSLFYTGEERDGMLSSGMEGGMNESFAALDALLANG